LIPAARSGMIPPVKRTKAVEVLIPQLESEDAFSRLEAEKRLRDVAQRDFGYRWDAQERDRAAALARVRDWIEGTKKAEKARRSAGAPGAPMLDLEKLKGMSAQEVEKHLQELLGKAPFLAGLTLGRPACEACTKRPATAEIVEIRGGRAKEVARLCDPCAAQRLGGGLP
jgi:hypothetical protein